MLQESPQSVNQNSTRPEDINGCDKRRSDSAAALIQTQLKPDPSLSETYYTTWPAGPSDSHGEKKPAICPCDLLLHSLFFCLFSRRLFIPQVLTSKWRSRPSEIPKQPRTVFKPPPCNPLCKTYYYSGTVIVTGRLSPGRVVIVNHLPRWEPAGLSETLFKLSFRRFDDENQR